MGGPGCGCCLLAATNRRRWLEGAAGAPPREPRRRAAALQEWKFDGRAPAARQQQCFGMNCCAGVIRETAAARFIGCRERPRAPVMRRPLQSVSQCRRAEEAAKTGIPQPVFVLRMYVCMYLTYVHQLVAGASTAVHYCDLRTSVCMYSVLRTCGAYRPRTWQGEEGKRQPGLTSRGRAGGSPWPSLHPGLLPLSLSPFWLAR